MNKPSPVAPIFAVESINEIHNFYVQKLGFDHVRGMVGKDGQFDFCTIAKDGSRVMFARAPEKKSPSPNPPARQRVSIYFGVADVERYFTELSNKPGVQVTEPPVTQWWGDRTFKVLDPNGYEIWFYQTVADPKPPQGMKII